MACLAAHAHGLRGMLRAGALSSPSAMPAKAPDGGVPVRGCGRKCLLFLGLMNGLLVGITAGIGMYVRASAQANPKALVLSFVVMLAMIGSCVVSGLSGALIPLTLQKLGADPATASSIFLTTATDVASMGLFLGLATLLVL